jgi:small conductance mechanosensitive channel
MIPLLVSDWDKTQDWLKANGTDILIILAVVIVIRSLFHRIFPRIARAAMMRGAHPPDDEMVRRADTIIGVIDYSFTALLTLIAFVTILTEFGIDVTAIVAGLGITGLALAMGSQQFVRDAINGIFLLAEDQFRQGDVVTIAGVTGSVESITLRRTVIRDTDGVVHSVPNGSITVVSNHTRDFAIVNVQIRVGAGEDMTEVERVIGEVGREMMREPLLSGQMTQAPAGYRVESIEETGVTIVVSARTPPNARWEVGAELRRRLAEALVRAGIRTPYPLIKQGETPNDPGARPPADPIPGAGTGPTPG